MKNNKMINTVCFFKYSVIFAPVKTMKFFIFLNIVPFKKEGLINVAMTITFNRKRFLVFQMVLKQPKKDKRTNTYRGNAIPKTVVVLLLSLSKNKNYFIKSIK